MNRNDHVKKVYEIPASVIDTIKQRYDSVIKIIKSKEELTPTDYAFDCGLCCVSEFILVSAGVMTYEECFHESEKTDG